MIIYFSFSFADKLESADTRTPYIVAENCGVESRIISAEREN